MSGPIHANRQQSQQAQLTQQEQQIAQQLLQQQTWDLAPNQTLEQRRTEQADLLIRRQQQDNLQLAAQAQARHQPAQAGQAADGAPVQDLRAAEKTAKQQREERRHAASARRNTPVGDAVSYDLHDQLTQIAQRQHAAGNAWEKQARQHYVSPDVLRGFLTVCSKHAPAAEQKKAARQNAALMENYFAIDREKRRTVMRNCAAQVLATRLRPEMLNEAYVEKHADQLLAIQQRLSSMRLMLQTGTNRFLLEEELSKEQLTMLELQMEQASALEAFLHVYLASKGVNIDGSYNPSRDMAETAQAQLQRRTDALRASVDQTEQLLADRLAHALPAERQQLQQQQPNQIRADADVMAQLDEIRNAIAHAPDKYTAQRPQLDRLYQQLYRTADTLGDAQREIAAHSRICDQYADEALSDYVRTQIPALRDRAALLRQQMDTLSDLIQFMIGQRTTLSEGGKLLAEREQLHDVVFAAQQASDEALWAADPEAMIARTQAKLDALQYSQHPFSQYGLGPSAIMQKLMTPFGAAGLPLMRQDIKHSLDQHSISFTQQPMHNPRNTTTVQGLFPIRMVINLSCFPQEVISLDETNTLWEHLLCAERLFTLQNKQSMTPDEMTEEEQTELASYTEERIDELEAQYAQGLRELKAIQLKQLRHIQQRYGRMLSQLHPEDLLNRLDEQYRMDISVHQDVLQMLHSLPDLFDANDPDDQEYMLLAEYLTQAQDTLMRYSAGSIPKEEDPAYFDPPPEFLQMIPFTPQLQQCESQVKGPRFNSAEMKAYKEILRRRFGPTQQHRLFGRFAPDADAQV